MDAVVILSLSIFLINWHQFVVGKEVQHENAKASIHDEPLLDEIQILEGYVSTTHEGKCKDCLQNGFDNLQKELEKKLKHVKVKLISISAVRRLTDALSTINEAIPKLISGEPSLIVGGISDILYHIGVYFGRPRLYTLGILRSLLNGVLGLYKAVGIKKAIDMIMSDAFTGIQDEELQAIVSSVQDAFISYKGILDRHRGKRGLSNDDVGALLSDTKTRNIDKFLDILETRIKQSGGDSTQSMKCLRYMELLSDLCKLELMNLIDASNILRLTSHIPQAEIIEAKLQENREVVRKLFKFLRLQGVTEKERLGVLSNFYPIPQNEKTRQLNKFLDYLEIPPVSEIRVGGPDFARIATLAYPQLVICSISHTYFNHDSKLLQKDKHVVRGCEPNWKTKVFNEIFVNDAGFYQIQISHNEKLVSKNSYDKVLLCVLSNDTSYIHSELIVTNNKQYNECRGDYLLFRFVPIKTDASAFLMSPKNFPGSFVYMDADILKTLKVMDGDPGPQGYWMIP